MSRQCPSLAPWGDKLISMADDGQLIARAIRGDQEALSCLLQRHAPDVRLQLSSQMPNRWRSLLSIDDVLQQTYADAFVAIGSLRATDAAGFKGWLAQLSKRNLIDAIRMLEAAKRGGDRRKVEAWSRDESYVALHEMLGAVSDPPSREARQREAIVALEDALGRLPDVHQRVVRMYDLDGCPIEDVANAIGRTVGATYMLRARALKMLSSLIGGKSKFFGDSM